MRIASLLPAATEFIAALGAERELVGVSHECDFPSSVTSLPRLTRVRAGAGGGGAIEAAALTPFELDGARLAEVEPEVVVTQDLCDVCAVPRATVEAALRRLVGRVVTLVSLSPRRLGDLFTDLAAVARAIGREQEAARVASGWRDRLDAVARRAAAAARRPRVVTVEWIEPVMLGGLWMPELVELAGGTAVGVTAGEKAPTPTREELEALAAEVVVLKPCGQTLERALADASAARTALPLTRWPAGATGRVHVADGSAYFNRPGPRLVESAELLAALVQPALFRDFAARYAGSFAALPSA
jgi:iron complex transport system substrate-binding protein